MSKVDDLTIKRNLNRCTAIAVENIDRSCLRSCYAAVVTNEEGIILSEGYTHVPRGLRMCRKCYRKENKIESGTCYEKCRSIHAEQDAIIKLSQTDNADAIYIVGLDYDTGNPIEFVRPCNICMKFILDRGIRMIYTPSFKGSVEEMLKENLNGEYDSLLNINR